jgi:UDP-glucose:tetrahydrobiopterin glucosyltransferase
MTSSSDLRLRVLLASTPVGPLGSGAGGGVELTLGAIALGLARRGHQVTVLAPEGSVAPAGTLVTAQGAPQAPIQAGRRDAPVTLPPGSVLAAMWDEVRRRQADCDVVLNFAYDWLPFYLTPFLDVPVAHLVSMGSLSDAMDAAIGAVVAARPENVAMHSRAQAATFSFGDRVRVLGNGIDVARYACVLQPERRLAWVGRIAPEKGLADAFAVAAAAGLPLSVWGLMEHQEVWQDAVAAHPGARATYEGFLATEALQAGLGRCLALLVTPHWVEAFGNVAMEALACGVPVVAYARGGPAEIVADGETGFLVPSDDLPAMIKAVRRIDTIDRAACRRRAEQDYSLEALAERVEAWLLAVRDRAT